MSAGMARLRSNQCPCCRESFTADTVVIRTASGAVCCATHVDLFVPDRIVETGPWVVLRRRAGQRMSAG
jgi:hypothetical protein